MKHYIYKTTNTVNNKIYIGKHSTDNLGGDKYLGSGTILKRAIKKYGRDKFVSETLFKFDTEKEALLMEAQIVDEMFIARLDTYNIKLGGMGGWQHINDGSKFHLECIKKGNINKLNRLKNDTQWANDYYQKVSNSLKLYNSIHGNPFKGCRHTEESKKKIGEANSKHQKGKKNSMYGNC